MTFIYLNKHKKHNYTFKKPGKYTVFFNNISGDYKFIIKSKDVMLDIFGIVIGKNDDIFNINTDQIHIAPKSSSNLLVKGILYDRAKLQLKGLIKIEKTGQKTKAYQKNQNILMSNEAFVDTKPYLEILADDVFCTHGSTTGKLDKNTLFYLNSRSINKKKAEDLILRGFLNEIFNLLKTKTTEKEFKDIQTDIINKI
ncbi:MAG: SufD family Fe-S cluster assembly protein [Patescibacteria group bacterium]